ncbi:DUF6892 domain-containing protein [Dactylosporangium sp. CA-233914]|uniref:DUF6892 domain-containing protein n=1 Tax=Dactylosporangium sp. CA-233914 TaxID=3239934 RepID=UPI003D8EE7B4
MSDFVTFPDRGLHLAVLDALLNCGVVSAGELVAGFDELPGDGYARVDAAARRLHARPLPADAVAGIESIDFDGGNDIYMAIEDALDWDTGGESDDYNLGSLAGIHALAALRSLDLNGHGYRRQPLDLTPLAGHPRLEELVLTGDCLASGVLQTLPALRSLDTSMARVDDPDVLPRLEARGVAVKDRRRRPPGFGSGGAR